MEENRGGFHRPPVASRPHLTDYHNSGTCTRLGEHGVEPDGPEPVGDAVGAAAALDLRRDLTDAAALQKGLRPGQHGLLTSLL